MLNKKQFLEDVDAKALSESLTLMVPDSSNMTSLAGSGFTKIINLRSNPLEWQHLKKAEFAFYRVVLVLLLDFKLLD